MKHDSMIENAEPIFFTEIDEDELENDNKKSTELQLNAEELNSLLRTCDEKDMIEDDLTVDSIQNNRTNSILIDDVSEGDR